MKNTQVTKTCEICGNSFKVKAHRADTARYCSKACWSQRNPPPIRQCRYCGKSFNSRDKTAKFCSNPCAYKWRSENLVGNKSTAWKGGKSLLRKRSQAKGDLAKWRKQVYDRDNYTCQECGQTGHDLHAHHIKPFADYPDLITDVSNGITLCVACHERLHGRKFSTPARYSKHCADCGATTSGRSQYCRSCSIHRYHVRVGHKSTNTGVTPVTSKNL